MKEGIILIIIGSFIGIIVGFFFASSRVKDVKQLNAKKAAKELNCYPVVQEDVCAKETP